MKNWIWRSLHHLGHYISQKGSQKNINMSTNFEKIINLSKSKSTREKSISKRGVYMSTKCTCYIECFTWKQEVANQKD